MQFTKTSLLSSFLLVGCFFITPVFADYATSEGLGNPNLVLEDETTRLSLFNFGNPAGLAFLAEQNRLDLSLQARRIVDLEEFTPGEGGIQIKSHSISTYTNDDLSNSIGAYSQTIEVSKTYVAYPNVSPDGTTLTPQRVYSWKKSLAAASLATYGKNLYQGVRISPVENISLQLMPLADWQTTFSTDFSERSLSWQTGGWLRGAYRLMPNLAIGAGILGTKIRSTELTFEEQSTRASAEAGFAYRLQEMFDDADVLDLGITLQGGKGQTAFESPLQAYTLESRPLQAGLHGIYTYKSVMDIGLNVDYLYEDTFRLWDSRELLDAALRTLDYELQFRVRLPMVRKDDLRFGVSFNNHGVEHPYPTGTLQLLNTAKSSLEPLIRTASSGISIGAALVPTEGSIIGLQYNLGSSLSRQDGDNEFLADSGYTHFTFAAQYQIIKGLTVRASYVDQRVVYESNLYRKVETITKETINYDEEGIADVVSYSIPAISVESAELLSEAAYTRTGNFGISIEDGPWKVSLTTTYGLTTYTPSGWSIEGKPLDVEKVNKDKEEELSGMLSLTWIF